MGTSEQAPDAVQEFWDDRYREKPRIWSGRVNPVLAAAAAGWAPGRVLDLGSGEGGDAIWFAQLGWDVTAVDVSAVALERGAASAAEAGVGDRITWEHHDLGSTFPAGTFDLVSAQFLQSPMDLPRVDVLRRAAGSVAPGGRILSVSHAAAPSWAPPAVHEHRFPTPEEERDGLALDPSEWDVVRCEVVERDGTGPDGQTGVLLDAVILAERRRA